MKKSIKITALIALSLAATQALAFETEVERVGLVYLNIPFSNHTAAPAIDKSVIGFKFGQTRLSTDRAGSLFTYFKSRPALFDVQFGMVGRKNTPDDVRFGLMDLKLTGISSIERTYINGQAVVGGIVASKVLMGAAAVGGIGLAAAASSSGSSSSDDSGNTPGPNGPTGPGGTTSHDDDGTTSHDLNDDDNDDDNDNDIADDDTDDDNDSGDDDNGTS